MVSVKQEEGKELNTDITYLSRSCGAYFIRRQFLSSPPSPMVSPSSSALLLFPLLVSSPPVWQNTCHITVWEIKGQLNMQNRALRDSKKKSIKSGNWEFKTKHRGLQCGSQHQPIIQWTRNQGLNVTRQDLGFTRTLAPPPSPTSNEKYLHAPSTTGTVFLEWAWAGETQSHLPVVKWTTTHSPQRLVMSARSTATPNAAGSGGAQMKQRPPTLRWVRRWLLLGPPTAGRPSRFLCFPPRMLHSMKTLPREKIQTFPEL